MHAVRIVDGQPVVTDESPPPNREGRVRVRVAAAGICGSDLQLVRSATPPPVVLGHEFAGHLDDGRPVAVEPIDPCHGCGQCRLGQLHRCETRMAVLGLTEDGGMAAECQVPDAALVALPTGLDVADALLVEPVAVAVHGLRRAHTTGAHRLVVIGGGTIGLAAAAVAVDGGAEVAVCARHPHQLEAAERLGARAVAPGEAPPFPADLVVEAAGTQSALDQAVGLAPLGGEVVVVSTYWEPVALGVLPSMREVTLTPAMMYGHHDGTRDVDLAAGVLARHPEVARTLITHRFPLEDAPRAFAVAADRASGASKVVLVP